MIFVSRKIKLFTSLLFALPFILSGQIVMLDTVHTTFDDIIVIGSNGSQENYAWYQADFYGYFDEIGHSYKGVLDTLIVNPNNVACTSRGDIYATDNHVMWNLFNSSNSSCQHNFIWEKGVVLEDQYSFRLVYDQLGSKFIVETPSSPSNISILDLDQQSLTPIAVQTAMHNYTSTNIVELTNEVIWIKAIKRDIATNSNQGQSIIRYDLATNTFIDIYNSPNFLFFRSLDYSDRIAFGENVPNNQSDIYYYNGATLQFAVNTANPAIYTFSDGFYFSNSSSPINYWEPGGSITQISQTQFARVIEQSRCFLAYEEKINGSSVLTVSNGNITETLVVTDISSIADVRLIGNDIVFAGQNSTNGANQLMHARHNLSCPNLCPDDDVSIDFWNSADFYYTRTIESIATIPPAEFTDYEASTSITLDPDFEVKLGADFHAYISTCP